MLQESNVSSKHCAHNCVTLQQIFGFGSSVHKNFHKLTNPKCWYQKEQPTRKSRSIIKPSSLMNLRAKTNQSEGFWTSGQKQPVMLIKCVIKHYVIKHMGGGWGGGEWKYESTRL